MTRLTTRSIRTATAIANAEPFTTSGSLRGDARTSPGAYLYSGRLNVVECEMLRTDLAIGIDYVVTSYSTPIAWRRVDGKWRVVAQSFSPTTTKHQGNLYLIDRGEPHQTTVIKQRGANQVRCEQCGTCPRFFSYVDEAHRFAHGHRFNHDHPIYSI